MARSTYYAWRQRQRRPQPARPHPGRPRRGYVYTVAGQKVPESQVVDWVSEYQAGDGAHYGYRKLTRWLRRTYDLRVNKKTVYRLLKEAGILLGSRFPLAQSRAPRQLARNRVVTGPNQLWETDLKYGYIAGLDRFFYLASVIDVYDRSILAYHIGWQCTAVQALAPLQAAVRARQADWSPGDGPTIRTDNGPQFLAHAWAEGCAVLGIPHERIPTATPNKNAHIESWHSLLEAECLRDHVFRTFAEAHETVTTWITFYNERRMHGSLDDWPPAQFYRWALAGQAPPIRAIHC